MISNIVQNRFVISRTDQDDEDISTIIPSASKVQVGTIVYLAYKANGANQSLKIYPFHSGLRPTVNTAAVAEQDSLILVGDATANELNGVAITTDDFGLVELNDGSWQLFDISTMTASTTLLISCTEIDIFDGEDGPGLRSAVAAGNTCYLIKAADIITRDAGTSEVAIDVPVACGEQGIPFAISLSSSAAGEAYIGGLVEYTESRRITAPLTQH